MEGDEGMKGKAVFLWGPVVMATLFIGALGLLKVYLAEAAGVLVEELTGVGADIESMDVAWFPPHVTIHGLTVDTGTERLHAPRVDLFPNFGRILDGRVSLDKAVLDQPILRSALRRHGSEAGSSAFDATLLPKHISIRNAAFVVDDDGVESRPVDFSADVEKGTGGFALSVKSMTIPEFGLDFSGMIDIRSQEPLRLSVDARKGTFNPSTLLDFLHRFEYLGEEQLTMFSKTEAVSAEEFSLDFDARAKAVEFVSKRFVLDASVFSQLAISSSPSDGWSLSCVSGQLDSAQMLALTRSHPDGKKTVAKALDGMGLKHLDVSGVLGLKDVAVESAPRQEPSGSLSLATPTFQMDLVSKKDLRQTLTLNDFSGAITFSKGKPTVRVETLELASSSGGSATVTGEAALPFSLAGTRFLVESRQFDWFGTRFDGSTSKKDGRQIDLDMLVTAPAATVRAKGLVRKTFGGSNRWSAVLDDLVIDTERENAGTNSPDDKAALAEAALDEPFDLEFVREGTLSGKIAVRRLQYNDLPVVRDMSARLRSVKGRTTVNGRGRICLMRVDLESALVPDQVAAKVTVRGTNVHFPGVLGCFINELPIYLRGRLSAQAEFLVHGKTPGQVRDSMVGDVVVRVSRLKVLKLSNLDKRLGFFLEIMNAVDVGPDEDDSVSFRHALVAAKIGQGVTRLQTVRLAGKRLSVEGAGRYDNKKKRLLLNASVTSPYGIDSDIAIDRVLSEERSQ